MASGKYNEMVVLVHPLYDLLMVKSGVPKEIRTDHELTDAEVINKLTEQYLNNLLKNEKNRFQLKHTLQAYGEEILKYKNKPETIVVIFLPVSPHSKVMNSLFNAIGGRFIQFCKDTLENRLFIEKNLNTFYSRKIIKKLNKNLTLRTFGEYKDICVKEYTESLETYLIGYDINVKTKKIYEKALEKGQIHWNSTKSKESMSLDNRVIYKTGRAENKIARLEKRLKRPVVR